MNDEYTELINRDIVAARKVLNHGGVKWLRKILMTPNWFYKSRPFHHAQMLAFLDAQEGKEHLN